MSESMPEDAELLLDPEGLRLASPDAAIWLDRDLAGLGLSFWNSVLVLGSLAAWRVDSKGLVR